MVAAQITLPPQWLFVLAVPFACVTCASLPAETPRIFYGPAQMSVNTSWSHACSSTINRILLLSPQYSVPWYFLVFSKLEQYQRSKMFNEWGDSAPIIEWKTWVSLVP